MIKKLLTLFVICFSSWSASAQLDSILYHDMQMESQWGSSTVGDQFGCFVRITPISSPAILRGIRGFFRNADPGSTIKWKVYDDPSGLANGGVNVLYLSPVAFTNPAAGGIANQQYDVYVDLTADNIVITSGDVYVGAVQTTSYFGAGIDNAPNNSVAPNRQWQWMNVFSVDYWNTLSSQASSGQFGFTAFFTAVIPGVNETQDEPMNVFVEQSGRQLYVQLPSSDGNPMLRIFDITGRLLHEQNISSPDTEIDISYFSTGVYTVIVRVNDRYVTRKFLKGVKE